MTRADKIVILIAIIAMAITCGVIWNYTHEVTRGLSSECRILLEEQDHQFAECR